MNVEDNINQMQIYLQDFWGTLQTRSILFSQTRKGNPRNQTLKEGDIPSLTRDHEREKAEGQITVGDDSLSFNQIA